MNMIQLKCPNCGADLEVEDGLDSFFCKYCGTKIVLEDQSPAAYTAKTVKHIADRLLDQREARRLQEIEDKKKHDKEVNMIMIVGIILIFLIAFLAIFVAPHTMH